ncbi:MAG: imidazole glycerol phosphate synthase subunit HisH [Lachnospiraceae bacterium]|nr:imidazole glycerol phosphate synthase subunit HisH [Lachnospiraceae bacterium]
MLAIVDYGVGNLFSLKSSVAAIGVDAVITGDAETILNAERIILPGVGAFGDAVDKLRATGLDKAVIRAAENGTPLLGICVGMQMLFEKDYEYGEHDGLGLIPGEVRSIRELIAPEMKVPAIGWSSLSYKKDSRLFKDIAAGEFVYFVHSYSAVKCEQYISAVTNYGVEITAAVEKGNVYGTQFHPEKSGEIGLKILKNFCNI